MKKYFPWILDLLVVFALVQVTNNYLGNQEKLINADGKGYYDYLPAVFIYSDLNFHYTDTLQTDYYDQKANSSGYLHQIHGKQINKYFPGAAILWTPFFLGAHYYAIHQPEVIADGYSWPYQKGIFYAALFYLWLGLFFLRKTLQDLKVNSWVILIIQTLLVFATPLIHYTQKEPAFTHLYSFTLITIFTFYLFKFLRTYNLKPLLIASAILGVITIIRPVNLMAVGVFFLYFNSWKELQFFVSRLFNDLLIPFLLSIIPFIIVVALVPFLWKYQTGHFFIWGYSGESFNFLSPTIYDFLFSFKRGAFLHTPLLFIVFVGGVVAWVRNKETYKALAFLMFFTFIVYVLSSWWSWYYGASFGSRPLIDFYILFALAMAKISNIWKPKRAVIIAGAFLVLFIPLNLIQARQYQTYIMDWNTMTFDKFRFIGLNTEEKYKGIYFQNDVQFTPHDLRHDKEFDFSKPISLDTNQTHWFEPFQWDDVLNYEEINYALIETDVSYTKGYGEFILSIIDSNGQNVYWSQPRIFTQTRQENTRSQVHFLYKLPPSHAQYSYQVLISAQKDRLIIYKLKLSLLHIN